MPIVQRLTMSPTSVRALLVRCDAHRCVLSRTGPRRQLARISHLQSSCGIAADGRLPLTLAARSVDSLSCSPA